MGRTFFHDAWEYERRQTTSRMSVGLKVDVVEGLPSSKSLPAPSMKASVPLLALPLLLFRLLEYIEVYCDINNESFTAYL